MPFALLYSLYPDIAEQETRTVTDLPNSSLGLPPAPYSFLEMFCVEPGCDCRRVRFTVVSTSREPDAVIAYGWESRRFYVNWMGDDDPTVVEHLQGPILNLASPQSIHADAILEMFREFLLSDEDYIERVKRHYAMFRTRIDGARLTENDRAKPSQKRSKRNNRIDDGKSDFEPFRKPRDGQECPSYSGVIG